MKKLPTYAKTLLLQGSSTLGNFTEGYFFIEENIKINHAKELFEFCKWIDKNVGGASLYNIDMLFSSYKNPEDEYLTRQVSNLAELIKQYKPKK